MKRLQTIIVVLAVIMLAGCSTKSSFYSPDDIVTYDADAISDTLIGKHIPLDSLNTWTGIESTGDYLVVLGMRDSALFTVMDAKSHALVTKFGTLGQGDSDLKGEIDMCQFSTTGNNTMLCVQERESDSIKIFDFTRSVETGQAVFAKKVAYSHAAEPWNHRAFSLGSENYAVWYAVNSIDTEIKARPPYIVVCKDGKETEISPFPSLMKSSDTHFLWNIYFALPRIKPDGKSIVEVMASFNMFTITDIQSGSTLGVREEGSVTFEEYQKMSNDVSENDEVIHKFDITLQNIAFNVSDKYIVLCQDGKTTWDEWEDFKPDLSTIRIFTWDGKLVYSFVVKEYLMRLAFNEKTMKLFGLNYLGKLFEYDLSDKLR